MGTRSPEAERRLRAALGPARSQPLTDCNGAKGVSLSWGSLHVELSDAATGGPVALYGWAVGGGRSRFAYALPYDVALGTRVRDVLARVPGATGLAADEGPYTGSYLVSTPRTPDLFWLSAAPNADGGVEEVLFRTETCD